MHPAEHDGSDGEQREGRQDAGHEGEAETHGDRAGARLGAPADIGADFGREPRERGRGRRTETGTRAQRVGERPQRRRPTLRGRATRRRATARVRTPAATSRSDCRGSRRSEAGRVLDREVRRAARSDRDADEIDDHRQLAQDHRIVGGAAGAGRGAHRQRADRGEDRRHDGRRRGARAAIPDRCGCTPTPSTRTRAVTVSRRASAANGSEASTPHASPSSSITPGHRRGRSPHPAARRALRARPRRPRTHARRRCRASVCIDRGSITALATRYPIGATPITHAEYRACAESARASAATASRSRSDERERLERVGGPAADRRAQRERAGGGLDPADRPFARPRLAARRAATHRARTRVSSRVRSGASGLVTSSNRCQRRSRPFLRRGARRRRARASPEPPRRRSAPADAGARATQSALRASRPPPAIRPATGASPNPTTPAMPAAKQPHFDRLLGGGRDRGIVERATERDRESGRAACARMPSRGGDDRVTRCRRPTHTSATVSADPISCNDEGGQRDHASSRSTPARRAARVGAPTVTTSFPSRREQRARRRASATLRREPDLGDLDDLAAAVRAARDLHDHIDRRPRAAPGPRRAATRHHRAAPASRAGPSASAGEFACTVESDPS